MTEREKEKDNISRAKRTYEGGEGQEMPNPVATVRVTENDELDVWVQGKGPAVVLVHGALFYYLLKPLAEALAERGYQVIWYSRRGYNGKPTGSYEVEDQGQDIVKILDALKISKAHVVGHSAGVPYALAVALDAPGRILSAALLDFMFAKFMEAPAGNGGDSLKSPAKSGNFEAAAEAFLKTLNYDKKKAEMFLPGSWDNMLKDASTWFTVEMPVLTSYIPNEEKVRTTQVPLAFLAVGDMPPVTKTGELLKEWQPNLTMLKISIKNHFFPVIDPAATAVVIDDWIRSLNLLPA